jgi:hypothetical protein
MAFFVAEARLLRLRGREKDRPLSKLTIWQSALILGLLDVSSKIVTF